MSGMAALHDPVIPGEGRGPVTERASARGAGRYYGLADWTPACAGEAALEIEATP